MAAVEQCDEPAFDVVQLRDFVARFVRFFPAAAWWRARRRATGYGLTVVVNRAGETLTSI